MGRSPNPLGRGQRWREERREAEKRDAGCLDKENPLCFLDRDRIGTRFLFPASILPKKTGFLFLTQEERMLYKHRHLEPKCLELLPTQTTEDLVHDEQIPGCLTKSLDVQRVIFFQLLSPELALKLHQP